MADPSPYIVAVWIADELNYPNFRTLREAISIVLESHLTSRSPEQIAELAEALEAPVHSQLDQITQNRNLRGIEPTFLLEGEPGSLYIKSVHTEALAILTRLQALTPDAFENFCVSLLSKLGAVARRVGGPDDGGIDFIATDLPVVPEAGPALRACYPVVLGQAKRYTSGNLVTLQEVRSFLGAALVKIDDLRRESERIGLYTPATFAFWTTSDFNEPALKFALDSGIWSLGGVALSQLANRLDVAIPPT